RDLRLKVRNKCRESSASIGWVRWTGSHNLQFPRQFGLVAQVPHQNIEEHRAAHTLETEAIPVSACFVIEGLTEILSAHLVVEVALDCGGYLVSNRLAARV